jgi:3-oxoacyl-[acyl-carrier-protein] synthase-1
MVAALGADVATNCAAARAGLVRSSPIEHYAARSDVEGDVEAVIGHHAGFLTRGFEGETRLVRLVQGALSDLIVQSSGRIDWNGPERFYVSLPDVHRPWSGLELIADEAARQKRAEAHARRQREEAEDDTSGNAATARRIVRKGAAGANWPAAQSRRPSSASPVHAGGLQAVAAALRDLASGMTETAVVVGVDSWLDETTLEWLDATGRLKRDGMPVGLQPGEAGVAIALRSNPSHSGRPSFVALSVKVTNSAPCSLEHRPWARLWRRSSLGRQPRRPRRLSGSFQTRTARSIERPIGDMPQSD